MLYICDSAINIGYSTSQRDECTDLVRRGTAEAITGLLPLSRPDLATTIQPMALWYSIPTAHDMAMRCAPRPPSSFHDRPGYLPLFYLQDSDHQCRDQRKSANSFPFDRGLGGAEKGSERAQTLYSIIHSLLDLKLGPLAIL